MSLLSALYLGGILNPRENLHDFPIALVNQDDGDTVEVDGRTTQQNFGDEITTALTENMNPEQIDLRRVGPAEAQSLLSSGEVYGSIVIPSDFTKRALILARASVVAGDVSKPVITVNTNPRASTFGVSLTGQITETALKQVNATLGSTLTSQVQAQLVSTGGDLAGAAQLTLSEPVRIITTAHDPLPDGTGGGLSAFYYALLLVLAGFTGATIVNALVDGLLGFTPTEFGPRVIYRGPTHISRLGTLAVKWLIMTVIAAVVSGLYLWISTSLGMPSPHSLGLYLFSAFAITAVGVTALSVMSAFGTAGLLINLVVFIILALPSSGGTLPLEASPTLYGWLAQFEPMHQIFLGTRSILYLNATADSGLLHAVTMTAVGLAVGLVFGIVFARMYDARGLRRAPNDG
ncbi:DUF3533 domain-containing protein [Rhodococcus fascians]|nr:DUF3533 domain-containing protein [Rhodococcus fascians]MBY4237869.1 DUF3533 domain-containing protein [Rhodococcus fascians]MBY4253380.1 DUF3533 domain-containing protein [Rhodococcus fascians]MBY4269017.1 DUF3533 domain-containing protein [Rhodococcus fascians]MBY4275070.1 DUF3533 domain-containing protein [Rhodococcus fascians]